MGVHSFNLVDYSPLLRAALDNLVRWSIEGAEPPPSAHPRLDDGTAAPMAEVVRSVGRIPGATLPDPSLLPRLPAVDLGPEAGRGIGRYPAETGAVFPVYVAALDGDGNEAAGLRLPDLEVPLATYLGWNPRHPDTGGAGQIIPMSGSTLALASSRAERLATGDPRPSIEERYRDRADYLARVRAAAERLAAQRYVLAEDVDLCVELAAERWDALVRSEALATPAGG
jgi:hypothetical protein